MRISSGGKSLVPFGGLTSIFCCTSMLDEDEDSPSDPPSSLGFVFEDCDSTEEDKEEIFLWFE